MIEAATNSEMSIMNNGLRPHLSAAQPPNGEPIAMPSRAIAATTPTCTEVRPSSALKAGVTGPITPRM